MKCPNCPQTELVMSSRDGVEIDYCPQCRGVWLDRGELDKLIERSATMMRPAARNAPSSRPPFLDSDHGYGQGAYGRRRKSWLADIFD